MFKNLVSFWKGKNFLEEVLNEFNLILENAQKMYDLVCKKLIYQEDIADLKEKIYALDKEINDNEKDIRKRVMEHLVFKPNVDLSTCLILMSVVKDAERLGDYCKNLYEIIGISQGPLNKDVYAELFNGVDKELYDFFGRTKMAFMESDENLASLSWEHKEKIGKKCEEVIRKLSKSDIGTNQAVCFTLMARHFKRLSSHLSNIATSVILPVDALDYYDEKFS